TEILDARTAIPAVRHELARIPEEPRPRRPDRDDDPVGSIVRNDKFNRLPRLDVHSPLVEVVVGVHWTFVAQDRGQKACSTCSAACPKAKTCDVIDPSWRVWAAAKRGKPRLFACAMYAESSGVIESSGFTITPSARTTRRRLVRSNWPRASPTPTIEAESVDSKRFDVSELVKTSVHGHSPSALASRPLKRKDAQCCLAKRSPLTRIVKRLK